MAISRGTRPGVPTEAAFLTDMLQRLAALERASSSGSAPTVDMTGFTFVQNPPAPTATRTGDTWYDLSSGESNVWDGSSWVTYAGGVTADKGFTYFQSATPTATTVGETWFDTNNGRAKVWDGFLWVHYALYPAGDTATGLIEFARNNTAGYVEGTGSLQAGPSGSPNLGLSGNRIVARDGSGAAGPLDMYASGYTLNGGPVYIPTAPDASDSDTSGGLRIGAAGGVNMGIDGNEIAARTNNVTSPLYLNLEGGPVESGGVFTGRKQIVAQGGGEAIKVEAVGNNRPFIAVYGGSSTTRAGYFGYPNPSDNSLSVVADKGPLLLTGNGSVRSATVYNATANDWGVFIEANGTLGRTASSERFKTNIEDLTADEAAEILADFDWVRFNYIDSETGEAKDMIQFGGIAERLDPKRPEFVGYDDEDRPAAIRYNAVWPLVARVTQDQQDRIDSLETTVAEQGEQIAALTARLDALG